MRPIFSASQRHDELNCQSELESAEGARDLDKTPDAHTHEAVNHLSSDMPNLGSVEKSKRI